MQAEPVLVPAVGADKAWPLALARASRDAMALGMEVTRLVARHQSLAELLEAPPDLALIAVLEGPHDSLGMIAISPTVMAGLIESQTIGKVSTVVAPARRPTRTDAAMVADWIERALQRLEAALAADDDLIWTSGFSYASFMDDPRPLGLLLEDVDYRVLEAEVSLASGAKTGGIILALPARGQGRRPVRQAAVAPDQGAAALFSQALGDQVMAAGCSLQAVLYRMTIPLSAVMRLEAGDVVPLPVTSLDQIEIEGIDGRPMAQGKLGQHRGMRAVRLTQMAGEARPPAPEQPVADMVQRAEGARAQSDLPVPANYLRTGTD
ncbi:MAG: FliM/FliN family flagellar motor switch protein [Erythrobacter sp.]|nr:FliM/FliN family flagellar motor switch protein [Erythrobacter sp.]